TLTPGLPQSRQSGVSRVNSGRLRRAIFEYDRGSVPNRLRVEGLDYLRRVSLLDEAPLAEEVPRVEPAIQLSKPCEVLASAVSDGTKPGQVAEALAGVRNLSPLIRALGINAVEIYVRWGYVERERGKYDWSYYDAVVKAIEDQGLGWFPMLLAGS